MDCLKPIIGGCGTPTNFAEKTSADGSQTSKSAKVSRYMVVLLVQFVGPIKCLEAKNCHFFAILDIWTALATQ